MTPLGLSTPRRKMQRTSTRSSGAIWADSQRGNYQPENDLERINSINIPTKVIVGEYDRIFVPLAQEIAEKITGADLTIIPNIGHLVNLEAPDQFRTALKSFIANLKQ